MIGARRATVLGSSTPSKAALDAAKVVQHYEAQEENYLHCHMRMSGIDGLAPKEKRIGIGKA